LGPGQSQNSFELSTSLFKWNSSHPLDTIIYYFFVVHSGLSIRINSIGDIPNGAGWQWATEMIKLSLDKFEKLPACIAYIGHHDMKEVKTATDKYHKSTISIGGKTGQALLAWADHILNIEAVWSGQQLKRIVRTRPTQYMDAKSRGDVVPDGTVWGDDMKVNYDKFRALFT
jgi:hypothetical protein